MYKFTCLGVAFMLLLIGSASTLASNDHLVQPSDLKQALEKNSEMRKANIQKLQGFFKTEIAQKALKNARLDSQRIEKAIPFLSDEELARLAAQSTQAHSDFTAGALNNQQITYILIALATAVIVLILVKA
jgi:hypothetical protein